METEPEAETKVKQFEITSVFKSSAEIQDIEL